MERTVDHGIDVDGVLLKDGSVELAAIPNLSASKITSGIFSESRIPDIRADVKTYKPSADSTNLGRIYVVRSGSGVKSKIYICVQNDANNYEWVQIGVST